MHCKFHFSRHSADIFFYFSRCSRCRRYFTVILGNVRGIERHGSADPTLCGGYAGPACWAAILIIHIAGSCATRIISQQILVTRLLVNCGEAISVSATVMTVNADNIMKRIHQSILLRMRRQGRTSRTPYSASIADCFHVML